MRALKLSGWNKGPYGNSSIIALVPQENVNKDETEGGAVG